VSLLGLTRDKYRARHLANSKALLNKILDSRGDHQAATIS
jgi:hypothetical protein